jgi:hypothetical protein
MAHVYGAQSVCLPVRSWSVLASMQIWRVTHCFEALSHVAPVAQSAFSVHSVGHSSVPLHL